MVASILLVQKLQHSSGPNGSYGKSFLVSRNKEEEKEVEESRERFLFASV